MATVCRSLTNRSNKSQHFLSEKENIPTAQLSDDDWICEPKSYEHPLSKAREDPWEKCHDVVDTNDRLFCKQLHQEISWLLVVASLFLGIVTGFTNTSLKWLQPNPEEAMVGLLRDVVQLLNNTSSQRTVPPPQPFVPKNHYIVVNQLWFLSMTLSISAVVVGTLCLQWLAAFRHTNVKHMPHEDALALRQLRFDGIMAWGVPRVPAILLVAVQSALVLFATGLLYLLWSVNRRVALPVAIVSGVSASLLALTTIMPLLQSVIGWILPQSLAIHQCPYKSPISWAAHRLCVLLAIIPSFLFVWLPRIKKPIFEWRKRQLKLLPDYLWQEYDELWRQKRERRGPQSSKNGTRGYSYYLVHSLASAMEALVFRNAVDTVHECLQDFHGTDAEVETFEELFSKEFPPAEEKLLRTKLLPPTSADGTVINSPTSKQVDLTSLRRDFLNAHALQHFVTHNKKLHRTLLPHRVELYVRIKNSSLHPNIRKLHHDSRTGSLSKESQKRNNKLIGSSIECPIQSLHDAQGLLTKLRIQFLMCAERIMDSEEPKENFLSAIQHVLDVSEVEESPDPQNDANNPLFRDDPSPLPTEGRASTLPSARGQSMAEEPTSIANPQLGRRQPTMATLVNDQDVRQSPPSAHADLFRRLRNKLKERSHDYLEFKDGELRV